MTRIKETGADFLRAGGTFLKELVKDSVINGMITVGKMFSTSIDKCIKYSTPVEHKLSMVFYFHHLKLTTRAAATMLAATSISTKTLKA